VAKAAATKALDQMVPRRIESEQLAIQHVRNRCQRMPISGVRMCERRQHTVDGYARGDLRILVDIGLIVVADEVMTEGLPKHDPRQSCEYEIHQQYRILPADSRMKGKEYAR